MKKFTAALCTVLLLIGAVLVPGAAAAGPALANTRAYCIMDADTGLVLAQQNMDEELHPASITKVMTLGLACEKAQGDWDDVKLTVTHETTIPDSLVLSKVSNGWPIVLAALKTLLETGTAPDRWTPARASG